MTQVQPVVWPDSIERYRAVILAGGGFATAGLLKLADLLAANRPLGGVDWLALVVALIVMAGVYFPANAWVKFAAALAGAAGQTIVAAFTDDRVTPGEIVTVAVTLLTALGMAALPNAPVTTAGSPKIVQQSP